MASDDGDNPTAAEPAAARARKSQRIISNTPRFEPGKTIAGRYRIKKLIAHGGMGDVYEATDNDLRADIALKTIRGSQNAARIERFRREIFLARKVTHPNVCRVFDLGRHELADGQVLFITMELLRGETLSAKLKAHGKLSTQEALRIVRHMAAAIDAAHEVGVIHRDLKPGNVMLVDEGGKQKALITDFGVAHGAGDPFEDVSGTGDVVGSPAYMSPEQIEGEASTPAADIYALGVVMFEMVTGVRPFQGEKSISDVAKRLKVDPPRPTSHVPDLPPVWDEAILRCLARDPKARFASAQEVVDALDGIVSAPGPNVDLGATDAPTVLKPTRPARPSRMRWYVGAALALALGGGALAVVASRDKSSSGSAETAKPVAAKSVAIAVLPFADRSEKKDQEYLSDGFSEELLVHLSKIKDLIVLARSSSFSFKSSTEPPATIGRKLGVSHLVEGSVAKVGERVHITARLIRAADGTQLWAESFDRTGNDVFAMQDEIASAIANALEVKLVPQNAAGARTANAAAHDHLLRGRAFARSDSKESREQAAAAFEAAIELDPNYAPPYAALAFVLSYLADYASTPAGRQAQIDRARQLARKGVSLGPDVAETHRVLADLQYTFGWEWDAAKQSLARALELEPRDADTARRAAQLYSAIGDLARADALARQAVELDPVSTSSWNELGLLHVASGRLADGRKAIMHALELNPRSTFAKSRLVIIDVLEGKGDDALARAVTIDSPAWKLVATALAEHTRGNRDGSQAALDKLIETEAHTAPYQIAMTFAWRGEIDRAFEWLDKAYAIRDGGMPELSYDPVLAKLRPDPRYKALLAKMGLR